jgi:ABC-type spermidine/putrescine transport system permease subunit II
MRALIWTVVLIVFLPVIYLLYAGLNNSEFMSADFRGVTLMWLTNAVSDPRFLQAFAVTLLKFIVVGSFACVLALVISIGYLTSRRWFRIVVICSLVILFVVPPTFYCLNLLSIGRSIGLDRGLFLTIVAQTVQALPTVTGFLLLTLRNLNLNEFEASVLLGAPSPLALWRFVGKKILSHLLLAFSIGGYISLDDLVANVYLGGDTGGISITKLIWESMRSDVNPAIAWYSLTLTIIGAFIIVQFARVDSQNSKTKDAVTRL